VSDRIHVATRKGLFTVERTGEGVDSWRVSGVDFLGDPVTMVLEDPRDGALYAALNLGHFGPKLHRRDAPGGDWREVAVPRHDTAPGQDEAPSVRQVWELTAGGADQQGLLWAGTIPGGLFVSHDRGESWRLNRALWDRPERAQWFGGGYDEPGIHSVIVDPRDSRRVVVGVSCGGVWVSEDGGESWECRTRGMYAAYMPPERREAPEIQDPHRIACCTHSPDVMWVQHHNGVFRTTDGGRAWVEIEGVAPSNFGFAVVVHPSEPGTAWLVPGVKDECRVPVGGRVAVARTRDAGRSFEVLTEGLPQEHAYDLVYRHALDIDARGDRLAMGSTTGSLWISEDQGNRWHTVSNHLPPIYCVRFGDIPV